jgi:hypothetical protein
MQTDWTAIGEDLELCDLIEAFGTPANKRKAQKHRAAIMAHISEQNELDGPLDLDALRDELAEFAADLADTDQGIGAFVLALDRRE